MLSAIIDRIKSNWGVLRIFALLMGCFVMSQAVATSSTMAMIFGAFILFQAVTNTGCFSTQGCTVPAANAQKGNVSDTVDTEFTEVKG
jgi:hypothetical protein